MDKNYKNLPIISFIICFQQAVEVGKLIPIGQRKEKYVLDFLCIVSNL